LSSGYEVTGRSDNKVLPDAKIVKGINSLEFSERLNQIQQIKAGAERQMVGILAKGAADAFFQSTSDWF
jgi:hypothetical protein